MPTGEYELQPLGHKTWGMELKSQSEAQESRKAATSENIGGENFLPTGQQRQKEKRKLACGREMEERRRLGWCQETSTRCL